MKDFYSGVRSLAMGWQIWVFILMVVNLFVPVFYFGHLEAKLTIAAFFAAGMTGMLLVKIQGFTRLLGLMHFFWIPLVIYLLSHLNAIPATEPFGIWIRVLILLNGASLVIDLIDVIRYILGEREPVKI